jgi:diguanylate cyclase (GGDEF)-like protein
VGEDGGPPSRDLVLAVLFLGAGALAILATFFPLSNTAPTGLTLAVGIGSEVVGTGLLLARRPLPGPVLKTFTIVGFLALSFLISNSTTQLGTALTAVPYMWFCVFFGAYLEPREARMQILLLCACFGVALLVSEVPTSLSLWVIYSATFVVTTEALLASNHALRVRARLDPLTGLLNRRGFEEAVEPILALRERSGGPVSLVVIDLDGFKKVNDSRGHLEGDRILARVADAWMKIKREPDVVGRFGGDEFIVALPFTSREQAIPVIERFAAADPTPWSYGLVEVEPRESFTSAVRRADRALYDAKEARPGRKIE